MILYAREPRRVSGSETRCNVGAAVMSAEEISKLLDDRSRGGKSAFELLIPLVYDDLRRIAR